VISPYKYELQCFYAQDVSGPDENGYYDVENNAAPFTTWTIQNPDGANDNNNLSITETRDNQSRTFEYSYIRSANQWNLLEPDQLTTISTWKTANATDSTITGS